jgi:uncharacterized protein (DUF934 family)
MPTLIRLDAAGFRLSCNDWVTLGDEDDLVDGPVIVSAARFAAEADALLAGNRPVGVRLRAEDAVEPLAYDLPRIALIALEFPKFRDGRAYTAAQLLRTRYGFTGEIRAVGEVLREQAGFMIRCGFDAFEPADGSSPEDWTRAAGGFHHVYQAAADGRAPAFVERAQ